MPGSRRRPTISTRHARYPFAKVSSSKLRRSFHQPLASSKVLLAGDSVGVGGVLVAAVAVVVLLTAVVYYFRIIAFSLSSPLSSLREEADLS